MDMKQIKELMGSMEKLGLKKLRIKEEKGFELELERQSDHPTHIIRPEPQHHFAPAPAHHPRPVHEEAPVKEAAPAGSYVTSPMVGTYYSSPSPDDAPFIKVGDEVDSGTVVCIIEAMKVMNEVKAGKKGRIAEIIIDNADPVEFGTKLFRIV